MLVMRDRNVEEIVSWFEQCYDVDVHPTNGAPFWRRVALPHGGGIGDQDARLINGMAVVAEVQQQVLIEQQKEAAKRAKNRGQ